MAALSAANLFILPLSPRFRKGCVTYPTDLIDHF
ncbi:hypothetical protein SFR_4959 [Streptomyces sp. FR-008]|nr:hypothetical protein SFR_4959 [Streptomyces sp. FR-008]